jgi:hypothetical protein
MAASAKAFLAEWWKTFKFADLFRNIWSWVKALDLKALGSAILNGIKSLLGNLRGVFVGLLGPTSWLGRAFILLTGPLGLIVTSLVGIGLLLRKWLGEKEKEKLKEIAGVYKERELPKDMIGKAIRSFQEKAQSQRYSAAQLKEFATAQLTAVEGYAKRAAEIAKARAEADLSPEGEAEFKKILDVGMVLQSDVQKLIAAQADALSDMRARITGVMVAEGPRATITRMDALDAERARYAAVVAEISTSNAKVVDALSKIAKYADQFANEARRRDDEERSNRPLQRAASQFSATPYGVK